MSQLIREDLSGEIWCPAARVEAPTVEDIAVPAINRIGWDSPSIPDNCRCIAGRCAKWEWMTVSADGTETTPIRIGSPDGEFYGRCGL